MLPNGARLFSRFIFKAATIVMFLYPFLAAPTLLYLKRSNMWISAIAETYFRWNKTDGFFSP